MLNKREQEYSELEDVDFVSFERAEMIIDCQILGR
jgi:hypothetical protein